MRGALVVAVCAGLAACGPSLTEVRKYLAGSPHRKVAVFPFDVPAPDRHSDQGPAAGPGAQPPAGPGVAAIFQNKLRAEGFIVPDRRKTEEVYWSSLLSRGAFQDVTDAATLARGLGAQAALVGRVDNEGERVDVRPAVWVQDSARPYRQKRISSEQRTRLAHIAIQLRLVEAASGRVVWESGYGAELQGGLPNVRDAVSNVLVDQLSDAYLKQGL